MMIGIVGMIAIIVLQYLLIAGVLTFEQQVGAVSVALLAVAVWLVVTGYLGRFTGKLPGSLLMSIIGASYVGFPIWAFWLGPSTSVGPRDRSGGCGLIAVQRPEPASMMLRSAGGKRACVRQ
jgi:hypothetical protein